MAANRIGRNFIILMLGQIAGRVLAFLTVIYLTRTLLDEGFGIIAFATSVLTYAELVVRFGFDTLGPREVARKKIPLDKLVGQVVLLRLLLLLPAVLGLWAFVWLANLEPTTALVILLYGISLVLTALDLSWVFLGDERMRPAATAEATCLALVAAGVFFLVQNPSQVILVPLIFLAARFLTVSGLLLTFFRTYGRFSLRQRLADLRPLFSAAMPLAGSQTVATSLSNFDLVLIGLILSTEIVGQYGAAYRVVWIPLMINQAYFISLQPTISRAFVTGIEPIMPVLHRSIQLVAALAIGIAIGGVILARPLIVFLFTDLYLPAVVPMQILLLSYLLHSFNGHYRSLLISFNHQGTEFRIMAFAAVLNIILNILLIPSLGIVGAALATLSASIVILPLSYIAVMKLIRPVSLGRFLIKPGLCAIIMGGTLFLTSPWHVFLRLAAGGAIYLLSLFIFRVFTISDVTTVVRGLRL